LVVGLADEVLALQVEVRPSAVQVAVLVHLNLLVLAVQELPAKEILEDLHGPAEDSGNYLAAGGAGSSGVGANAGGYWLELEVQVHHLV
jgi:hypothetical protein